MPGFKKVGSSANVGVANQFWGIPVKHWARRFSFAFGLGGLAAWSRYQGGVGAALQRLSYAHMDFLILVFVLIAVNFYFKKREQRQRIILLSRQLAQFQIEKLMQTLADGYLRALGEADLDRRNQVWRYLDTAELQFCEQFNKFSQQIQKLDAADTRVSKFPVGIAYVTKLLPKQSFDLRQVIAVHAEGITQAANNAVQRTPSDKAFVLSAELFLMQHTCHWFCNTKDVASARLLARHKVSYKQVLDSCGADMRRAYLKLTGD